MNDYMQALRERFYTPPNCEELSRDYETAHTNLHSRLNSEERKLLLRLLDMENKLRDEASLHSFISGFRLACGIHQELAQERTYSFENDEERRAEEIFIREQEAKACQENAQTARAASESERTGAGKAGTR